MPISWVNSINPIFVIVLSGVFAAIWTRLGDRAPSAPVKFSLGAIAIVLGIALLAAATPVLALMKGVR